MADKNIWLRDTPEAGDPDVLIEEARKRYIRDTNDTRVTDDKAVRKALEEYVK
jgi:hypothetical protein